MALDQALQVLSRVVRRAGGAALARAGASAGARQPAHFMGHRAHELYPFAWCGARPAPPKAIHGALLWAPLSPPVHRYSGRHLWQVAEIDFLSSASAGAVHSGTRLARGVMWQTVLSTTREW